MSAPSLALSPMQSLSRFESYLPSQNQPGELFRQSKLTETPDQKAGRAFSYLYVVKGLRRTRRHGPRSLFQPASTTLRT